jgi:hypothetical protein
MRYPPKIKLAAIAAGPLAAAAVVTAGCGSTTAPARSAAAGSPSATVHQGSGTSTGHNCQGSAMKVSLDKGAAGVAAGSSYIPLQFENTSSRSCTMPSYPQVSFASGSSGPDIGLPAAQAQGQHAQTVTLGPGQTAYAWLRIMDAAAFPASACKPVTAQGLRVSLTASTAAAFIAQSMPACQGSPQGGSILAVYPTQAGQAVRGSAP